jgi:hypothetical protein
MADDQIPLWREWKESLPEGVALGAKEQKLFDWDWDKDTQLPGELHALLVQWSKQRK